MNEWLRKKKVHDFFQQKGSVQLERTLSGFDLILLGVGAIVGTGIFILPGTVAAVHAGPAIVFSFIIAAIVCAFAGLCYSEFASAVPVTGSAYSYSYVIFGEVFAWLVGWVLILEYGLAVASVATGWSSYLMSLLEGFQLHIPTALSGPFNPAEGTYINLPAIAIIMAVAFLLTLGVRESTRINTIMVFIKVGVIVLFLVVGIFYVKPDNWQPFMPYGVSGVLSGAALVFFAFLGFDSVSNAAEEVKNPKRNLPIGIIGSLFICTLLYVSVSLVLTGIAPYTQLNVSDPVSFVIALVGQDWISGLIALGAVVGMMTVILVMSYGGSRLLYALSRDGLLPKSMSSIHPKYKTPIKNTLIFAVAVSLCAGFVPLAKLAELVNMGTLIAFSIVSIGVIFLRNNKSIQPGGFKVPFYPVLPIVSFLLCVFLMSQLAYYTWIACVIWLLFGLAIYIIYGRKHSIMND
ncbi:amino acid permease [Paenibacillus camelliae]|uniref:amino acid permease n=1 Tax=Paenibacillus camelliae TaxID=512410 RepID=UPI00203CD69A|nr:amino acid permease [Paenibacillus camelliae]MCM3634355.1 amino acid permease [Paenibacillus camelliae]